MRKSQVEGSAWLFVLGEIWYDMGRVWGDVFLGYYFGRRDLGKSWKGIVQGLQKKCGWDLKLV